MTPSDRSHIAITVLWAAMPGRDAFVVRAWDHGLDQAYGLEDDIEEAKEWMDNWGDDGGFRYWTTVEAVPRAAVPVDEEAFC